jgi:hypothetical protein
MADWYERRDELESGMCFACWDGSISYQDSTVEPADLKSLIPNPKDNSNG